LLAFSFCWSCLIGFGYPFIVFSQRWMWLETCFPGLQYWDVIELLRRWIYWEVLRSFWGTLALEGFMVVSWKGCCRLDSTQFSLLSGLPWLLFSQTIRHGLLARACTYCLNFEPPKLWVNKSL
jgi:hypothetical protein